MVNAHATPVPGEIKQQAYGGFWRRFIAWIIDWIIVSTCVSLVFLLIAAIVPEFGNVVELQVPFGLFTIERTLESKTTDSTDPGGAAVSTTESIVEETILGKWTYRYRVTKTVKKGPGSSHTTTTDYQRIDPVTKQDISGTGLDRLILIVLVIYWTLMEASRYQASFGKLAFGMKVVNTDGSRLNPDGNRTQSAQAPVRYDPVHRIHDGGLDQAQAGAARQDCPLLCGDRTLNNALAQPHGRPIGK